MRALIVTAALAAALLGGCNQQSASEIAAADSANEAAEENAAAAKNMQAGKAYLAQNASVAGVTTLPSGVQYRVLREGPAGGKKPGMQDEVTVHYEGKLVDGKVFDSSYERGEPTSFRLNMVIPGWAEALTYMKPGDVFEVVIPAELGYGREGKGDLPPNSTLIFKIELLGVLSQTAMG